MAKLAVKPGTTSLVAYVFIQDSSVTTGAGLTGLAFGTGSLVASYVRPLAARSAITLVTQTTTGAFSSGGFIEVDATNMPGVYRLDVPDAAIAVGVRSVVVMLKGAANMSPCTLEIDLSNQSSVTAWNDTAVASPHTAGYPAVTVKVGTGTGEISSSSGNVALTSTANTAIATELMGTVVENNGSYTLKGLLRLGMAALFGRSSISGSTVTYKTADNVKTRVTTVTDSTNQRTTVTLDVTD